MSLQLQQHVDLRPYNSFGVAAETAWFVAGTDADSLQDAVLFAGDKALPLLILGGGSNMLFVRDYSGLVLQVANHGIDWLDGRGRVRIAAGESWHGFVITALNNGFYGIENLALIPGTVGAAPIQNIGAYGVELAEVFVELEALNLDTGAVEILDREACQFGYRDSLFKTAGVDAPAYLILSVTLQLSPEFEPRLGYGDLARTLEGQAVSGRTVFEAVCEIRRRKLPDPDKLGNAGSFFKNPLISREKYEGLRAELPTLPAYETEQPELVKVPAAALLEAAGWKGRQRGRAAVHAHHALVLVNPGGASGEDLFLLAQDMSSSVLQRFGVALQPEVRIIA